MRNLLFILTALISGVVSAQHINGVKTISVITAPNETFDAVIYGIPTNNYIESSYVVDPNLFQPASFDGKILEIGKLYKIVVRDGVIKSAELVNGPLKEDGTLFVSTSTASPTDNFDDLDIAPETLEEFTVTVAAAIVDVNPSGFEQLIDGHLRISTNVASPIIVVFNTLNGKRMDLPKNVALYRINYWFNS